MPEVYLKVEWPGNKQDEIYSPSTVITQYFERGMELTVAQFELKVSEALGKASQRVYERYGYECTSAIGELNRIKRITSGINDKNATIKIL
ncbi:MSMEG_0570 family nitrogen starvation response protein [Desertivirga xinjiangensis]|uniref:MSMEG_0570 family nitrogen starvation response protein n=1 Tax=Desertivirga xinjiangensis TaxID=539206 RepID=UPI00210A2B73|nr:MSMEG_0570 family nitrogen starvation response protein [Pedobacter xinjiangensis]